MSAWCGSGHTALKATRCTTVQFLKSQFYKDLGTGNRTTGLCSNTLSWKSPFRIPLNSQCTQSSMFATSTLLGELLPCSACAQHEHHFVLHRASAGPKWCPRPVSSSMQQDIQNKVLVPPSQLVFWIHPNHQITDNTEQTEPPSLLLKLLCKSREKSSCAARVEEGKKYFGS